MICSKCNHQNSPGMKYCGSCGNPISGAPMQRSQPPPAPQASVYQQPPKAIYTPPAHKHQAPPVHHIPQSTFAQHHHQKAQHQHCQQPQSSKRTISTSKTSSTSRILFSLIAAAGFSALFLPVFALSFWGGDDTIIITDLLFDSNIERTLQMVGIGYVRLFAAVLLLCPVLLLLLHNIWGFVNQSKKILYTISILVSAAGIIMFLLIWISLQDLIPPGWGDFSVDPQIGFFAAIFTYGTSLVVSVIYMRTST